MYITAEAHAKINWSLNILSLRGDGYHELDMLMQPLALSDTLSFESARMITLTCDNERMPVGEHNLIVRAANALNSYMGQRNGAKITLKKRIPSRAGLGGGSADCAVTLLALNKLWNLHLPMSTLLAIGKTLGADVPFCMTGGLARVGGIGEALEPIEGAPETPLVLVTPGGGLSTASVFQAYDNGGYPIRGMDTPALAKALTEGDWERAQALSFNALEAPAIALMPEIGTLLDTFCSLGARMTRMTGSGSTVFAAFSTAEKANAAAARIPGAMVTSTLTARTML